LRRTIGTHRAAWTTSAQGSVEKCAEKCLEVPTRSEIVDAACRTLV
jgi:hypothetical protein